MEIHRGHEILIKKGNVWNRNKMMYWNEMIALNSKWEIPEERIIELGVISKQDI